MSGYVEIVKTRKESDFAKVIFELYHCYIPFHTEHSYKDGMVTFSIKEEDRDRLVSGKNWLGLLIKDGDYIRK